MFSLDIITVFFIITMSIMIILNGISGVFK